MTALSRVVENAIIELEMKSLSVFFSRTSILQSQISVILPLSASCLEGLHDDSRVTEFLLSWESDSTVATCSPKVMVLPSLVADFTSHRGSWSSRLSRLLNKISKTCSPLGAVLSEAVFSFDATAEQPANRRTRKMRLFIAASHNKIPQLCRLSYMH